MPLDGPAPPSQSLVVVFSTHRHHHSSYSHRHHYSLFAHFVPARLVVTPTSVVAALTSLVIEFGVVFMTLGRFLSTRPDIHANT